MSEADSSALSILSPLYFIGSVFVLLGVILEGTEIYSRWRAARKDKLHEALIGYVPEPKMPKWVHNTGVAGWFLLVLGLALELPTDHLIDAIKDRHIATLTTNLASAVTLAAEANRQAGLSNERAALTESNNLILRANVAELELSMLPRRLKDKKASISRLARFANTPITLVVIPDDREAEILRNDIGMVAHGAGWKVLMPLISHTNMSNLIRVAVSPPKDQPGIELGFLEEAAFALMQELHRDGIAVRGGLLENTTTNTGCVVVSVGERGPLEVERYIRGTYWMEIIQTNRAAAPIR